MAEDIRLKACRLLGIQRIEEFNGFKGGYEAIRVVVVSAPRDVCRYGGKTKRRENSSICGITTYSLINGSDSSEGGSGVFVSARAVLVTSSSESVTSRNEHQTERQSVTTNTTLLRK